MPIIFNMYDAWKANYLLYLAINEKQYNNTVFIYWHVILNVFFIEPCRYNQSVNNHSHVAVTELVIFILKEKALDRLTFFFPRPQVFHYKDVYMWGKKLASL